MQALHKEADLSLDDLVDSLPPEYIKKLLHNHHSISSEPNVSSPALSKPVLKEAEQELGNRELSNAAELAQNLQPSGNTLSTTKVSIPIPPLLKGGAAERVPAHRTELALHVAFTRTQWVPS